MKTYSFEDHKDFQSNWIDSTTKQDQVDAIVESIEEALYLDEDVANVYEINVKSDENTYEIYLPKDQWREALDNCLEFYQKAKNVDGILEIQNLSNRLEEKGIKHSYVVFDFITGLPSYPS